MKLMMTDLQSPLVSILNCIIYESKSMKKSEEGISRSDKKKEKFFVKELEMLKTRPIISRNVYKI